jgi:BirA family biotin operon repressor/biotin-[acetyl-CoA-carboxylase] ligase
MSGTLPPHWRLHVVEELPSTQDAAMQAARAGDPGKLAIMGRRQTAGRGSRGRVWQAPAGNLNFSALIRPGARAAVQGEYPLLAGLALYDAIAPLLPAARGLMLKWPNDLLLDGAKLAGILIDSAVTAYGALDWVVIGIGVNIAAAPDIPGRRTTSLAAAGGATTPEELAPGLAHALDRWLAAGFADIRATWLARAHPIGTRLAIQNRETMVEGAFAGLAPNGGLLLAGHDAPITIGEIHLGRAQTVPCFSS